MHDYVKLFFTSLTVKPVIVVEAAHSALSQVRRVAGSLIGLCCCSSLACSVVGWGADPASYCRALHCLCTGHYVPSDVGEPAAQGSAAGVPAAHALLVP
jgi:hypothetical protein